MINYKKAKIELQEADVHMECLERKLKDIFWDETSNEDITADDLVRFRYDLQEIRSHARRIFGCCKTLAEILNDNMKQEESE